MKGRSSPSVSARGRLVPRRAIDTHPIAAEDLRYVFWSVASTLHLGPDVAKIRDAFEALNITDIASLNGEGHHRVQQVAAKLVGQIVLQPGDSEPELVPCSKVRFQRQTVAPAAPRSPIGLQGMIALASANVTIRPGRAGVKPSA